ncbi:MAG TPA: class I SAM-dependent methyltransferase [Thermoanaerobaculia bacterium]|nr:class I SAM-dependent methyltransferase [Thermoanaerobaculia bacterium]
MSEPHHYLLGDSTREAERLRFQARLWDPVSHALFDRLGIGAGWRVLEIGPGAGSVHMELRRRVQGPVDAVEQSASFSKSLIGVTKQDGFGPGRIWTEKLQDVALPANTYDLIFARWVFLFLHDPVAHLLELVGALKPGGMIAIQDYYRDTFCLVPLPPSWDAFKAADRAFFATQDARSNIGAELPRSFSAAGLQTVDITPTIKTGHPGSNVWKWLTDYYLGVLDQYAKLPPFNEEMAAEIRQSWLAAEQDPASLLIAPTVLDVVGRK